MRDMPMKGIMDTAPLSHFDPWSLWGEQLPLSCAPMMLHLVQCIDDLRSSNQDNLPHSCLFVIFSHTHRKVTNTAINATINWWPYVNDNRSEHRKFVIHLNYINSAEGGRSDVPHTVARFSFWPASMWPKWSKGKLPPPPAPHGESSYSMVRMTSWWRWRWWGWRSGWVLMTLPVTNHASNSSMPLLKLAQEDCVTFPKSSTKTSTGTGHSRSTPRLQWHKINGGHPTEDSLFCSTFLCLGQNHFAFPVVHPQALASGRVQIFWIVFGQQCWNLAGEKKKNRASISINTEQQGSHWMARGSSYSFNINVLCT